MFTLTRADDATLNMRPLTTDEIDLVSGGLTVAFAAAAGGLPSLKFANGVPAISIGPDSLAGAVAKTTANSSSAKSIAISVEDGAAVSFAVAAT